MLDNDYTLTCSKLMLRNDSSRIVPIGSMPGAGKAPVDGSARTIPFARACHMLVLRSIGGSPSVQKST